jgi:nitric oxide reductase NorE protein
MVATQDIGPASAVATQGRRVPGEPGIWIFVLLDMSIFAEMFGIFAWYRADQGDLFGSSQRLVNPLYGLVYTLLLLSSSWCVVLAVSAARKRMVELSSKLVVCGFGLGAAFAVLKFVEYGGKFSAGITPQSNEFFMFYFVMTFVHLLHALVGLGVLTYMRRQIMALTHEPVGTDSRRERLIVSSAIYWHMVDLLWIVLFALFYLRG